MNAIYLTRICYLFYSYSISNISFLFAASSTLDSLVPVCWLSRDNTAFASSRDKTTTMALSCARIILIYSLLFCEWVSERYRESSPKRCACQAKSYKKIKIHLGLVKHIGFVYIKRMRTHEIQSTIRNIRLAQGLTQAELAHLAGVLRSDIANYESRVLPPIDKLDAIAKALGKRVVIELRRVR